MASSDFISIEAPCEADAKDEGGDVQVKAPVVNGVEPPASELQPEGDAGSVGSNPKPSDGKIHLEEGKLEDMDLAHDDIVVAKDRLPNASVQPEVSVPAVQTVSGFQVKLNKGDGAGNATICESNSISVQESCILLNGVLCISANILLHLHVSMFSEDSFVSTGSRELHLPKKRRLVLLGDPKNVIAYVLGQFLAVVPSYVIFSLKELKRAHVESKEPSARAICSDLTSLRESKRKLMGLMQLWSEGRRARRQHNMKDDHSTSEDDDSEGSADSDDDSEDMVIGASMIVVVAVLLKEEERLKLDERTQEMKKRRAISAKRTRERKK